MSEEMKWTLPDLWFHTLGLEKVAAEGDYFCPVDGCDWAISVPKPRVSWVEDRTQTSGNRITVKGLSVETMEGLLETHFNTHTAVEFLKTINRLTSRVAELRSECDSLQAMAVGEVY